MHRPPENIYL